MEQESQNLMRAPEQNAWFFGLDPGHFLRGHNHVCALKHAIASRYLLEVTLSFQ